MNAHTYAKLDDSEIAALILSGKIGVIPTDTQYGLVCAALDETAVERVYEVRGRTAAKPCVALAASLEQLLDTDGLDRNTLLMAEKYWPGPVSVVVPCKKNVMRHIHRGGGSIAIRIPNKPELLALLDKSGLLLAPSANLQGEPPAATIAEAQGYFGDRIDFYVDGGTLKDATPSTLITFTEDGLVETLRRGAVTISENGRIT